MDSPGVDPVAIGLPAEDAPSGAASTPFAPERLRYFVTESNRIEGIRRTAMARELRAHARLLASERVTVADLERFVQDVAGKPLRRHVGYDVRVGSHIAPPGGPAIEIALAALLDDVAAFADPYRVHVIYETLHPFLDGNGRTSRLLSAVCLYRAGYDFRRLFTISEYYDRDRQAFYQALQSVRESGMDMTGWLEYFVQGLAAQLSEVKKLGERAIRRDVMVGEHQLSDRQAKALEYVLEHGSLTANDFQLLCPDTIRRSLQRDLRQMVQAGVL